MDFFFIASRLESRINQVWVVEKNTHIHCKNRVFIFIIRVCDAWWSTDIKIQFIDAIFHIFFEMEVHVCELTLFQITFANVCENGLVLSELMHSYIVCALRTVQSDLFKYYAFAWSTNEVKFEWQHRQTANHLPCMKRLYSYNVVVAGCRLIVNIHIGHSPCCCCRCCCCFFAPNSTFGFPCFLVACTERLALAFLVFFLKIHIQPNHNRPMFMWIVLLLCLLLALFIFSFSNRFWISVFLFVVRFVFRVRLLGLFVCLFVRMCACMCVCEKEYVVGLFLVRIEASSNR